MQQTLICISLINHNIDVSENIFWRQPVLNSYELCIMSKLLEVRTQLCVDGSILYLSAIQIVPYLLLYFSPHFLHRSLLCGASSHLFYLYIYSIHPYDGFHSVPIASSEFFPFGLVGALIQS